MNTKIIIAIDGHSSTGKSTFAKAIAAALGYTYLDSGALYRCVTLYALQQGWISASGAIDAVALEAGLEGLEVKFGPQNHAYLNGTDVESQIRGIEVSQYVSPVSALPFVRAYVDARLRRWGEQKGIVMDGRDIGTAVFPQAELKLFMTAPAAIRAQRRYDELIAKGQTVQYEDILANVESRDYQDSHRATNPLRQAADAIVLDNSNLTVEQQMEWFMELFHGKWGKD